MPTVAPITRFYFSATIIGLTDPTSSSLHRRSVVIITNYSRNGTHYDNRMVIWLWVVFLNPPQILGVIMAHLTTALSLDVNPLKCVFIIKLYVEYDQRSSANSLTNYFKL